MYRLLQKENGVFDFMKNVGSNLLIVPKMQATRACGRIGAKFDGQCVSA
jgi:hypothetical protein